MEAVGYDLYCKMLNEAVKKLKGETVTEQVFETAVEIKVDAFIPNSYIKNELQKLDIYKRIAEIENEEEKFNMIDELIDRFWRAAKKRGEILLAIALLKEKAHRAYITEITSKKNHLRFSMYPKAPVDPARIPPLIQKMQRRLRFVPDTPPYFEWETGKICWKRQRRLWMKSQD